MSVPRVVRLVAWKTTIDRVLLEAKKPNPHGRPTPTVGDVQNKYFTPADKRETERLQREYARLRGQFAKSLSSTVDGVGDGVLSANDLKATAKRLVKKYYRKAYELGKTVTADAPELSDDDIEAIAKEADDEIPYVSKFGDDVAGGDGRMDYQQRAGMYTKALDSVFTMGQVAGLPNDALIFWRLGIAEHCARCVELEAGSPYTVSTLPTVPRAGETPCLSRCKCFLDIDIPEPADPPAPDDKPPARDEPQRTQPKQGRFPRPDNAPAAGIPTQTDDGEPVPDDAAAEIEDLRAKMNYYRQRAELATDGDERTEFLRLRKETNRKLIDLEDETGVRSIPTWSVRELVQAVKEAPLASHVTKSDDVSVDQPVAIVKGRSVWRGRVAKVDGRTVTVKTREGDEVEIKPGKPPYLMFDAPDIDFDGDGEVEDEEDWDLEP